MLDARRIYVIGLPLLAGVGIIAMPDIAGHFPPWAAVVVASTLANATILALALTLRPECRRIQPGVNDHRA